MTAWRWVACACLLAATSTLLADDGGMKEYPTKYYLVHTDLEPAEAREAQVRMTRMAEEYQRRTEGFSGRITTRLPFYLYKDRADYTKAGGIEKSAGYFDGERLMAVTLRTQDGAISLSTWDAVQHEGFHQFAHAVIGDLPMWADEGLGEYFGEGLFTGDGFVTGLIPQSRLVRVQKLCLEGRETPLRDLLNLTRDQWNQKIEMSRYDQAWSLVHFLAHGEQGRLQKAFVGYMKEVGKGQDWQKAYNRYLGSIPNLEDRWKRWWIEQPNNPTADGYARVTLAMLTSFLARAHAQGQTFADFEALVKTPAEEMKQGEVQWLPPGLWKVAVSEASRMRGRGVQFVLVKGRAPAIVMTMPDGGKFAGRFEVKGDEVSGVRTEVVAGGKRQGATEAKIPDRR